MGRVLIPTNLPYHLYHKLYSQKLYHEHEDNPDPVYANWLYMIISTFKNSLLLHEFIGKLKQHILYPQTYSLKKDKEGYRLEIYFYYSKVKEFSQDLVQSEFDVFINILKSFNVDVSTIEKCMENTLINDCLIWSYDFYDYGEKMFGESINFYNIYHEDCNTLVYKGKQYTKTNDQITKEGYFLCFPARYIPNFKTDLNYNLTDNESETAYKILAKYDCLEYNISNKTESSGDIVFFVQYFGISEESFMNFLIKNHYPSTLINELTSKPLFYKTMSKEITEVYKSNDLTSPYRSALYGLI